MQKTKKISIGLLISSLLIGGNSFAAANKNMATQKVVEKTQTQENDFNKNLNEVFTKIKLPNYILSTNKEIPELKANYVVIDLKTKEDKFGNQMAFIVFNNGKIIMPYDIQKNVPFISKEGFALNNIINFEKNRMENNVKFEDYMTDKKKTKIAEIYQEIKDESIVLNNNKDKIMVIFTDPHCPACNGDLSQVEEYLKEYNVHIVLTPLAAFNDKGEVIKENSLHANAPIAAANIFKEIENIKTNEDKLKILRKHFNTSQKVLNINPPKEDMDKVIKINQKYLKTGLVDRTPFKIILTTKQ